MDSSKPYIAPSSYYPHNDEIHQQRGTHRRPDQYRTYVGDQERARNMFDFRQGRESPPPDFTTAHPHRDIQNRGDQRESQTNILVPPPRNTRRMERVSVQSNLTPMQTRHLRDIEADQVCLTELRENKRRSVVSGAKVAEDKAGDDAGDIEKQDGENTEATKTKSRKYIADTDSKTLNVVCGWIGMPISFYGGILFLIAFLASTVLVVLQPPRTLAIMTVRNRSPPLFFSGR